MSWSFFIDFLFSFYSGIPNFANLADDQLKLMIQTSPDSGKPSCGICLKEFFDRINVLNHLKAVHVNRGDQKCCYCPLAFSTKKLLRQHISRKHLEIHRMNKFLNKKVCSRLSQLFSEAIRGLKYPSKSIKYK